MGAENRRIHFRKKVKYKQQYDTYTLQLKRPCRPWWLLLLLLLLLVRCNKDIVVYCVDPETQFPVSGETIGLAYDAHFLWNDGRFFDTQSIARTQVTDVDGKTVFEDLPCSIYSYIFYCLSKVSVSADSDCFVSAGKKRLFHYTRRVKLTLQPRYGDLYVKIVDNDTGEILPKASISYRYFEQGEERSGSAHADAAGVATMPNMRCCSNIDIMGSCYGYADTTVYQVPGNLLSVPSDSMALRLRPLHVADVVFLFDCTGSMDSYIENVKNNVASLTKGFDIPSDSKLNWRVRAMGYRDFFIDEEPLINHFDFTNDVNVFANDQLARLKTGGGGDAKESALDAIWYALKRSKWRPACTKVIVLFTDEGTKGLHKTTIEELGVEDNVAALRKELENNKILLFMYCKTDPAYGQLARTERAQVYQYRNPGSELLRSNFGSLLEVIGKTISSAVVTE